MTLSTVKTDKASTAVPAVARPTVPAHIIKDDAEALSIAKKLASGFAVDAAKRDRDRIWPQAELDAFSQSGLWSINVPKAFGGPELCAGQVFTLSKHGSDSTGITAIRPRQSNASPQPDWEFRGE